MVCRQENSLGVMKFDLCTLCILREFDIGKPDPHKITIINLKIGKIIFS